MVIHLLKEINLTLTNVFVKLNLTKQHLKKLNASKQRRAKLNNLSTKKPLFSGFFVYAVNYQHLIFKTVGSLCMAVFNCFAIS